MTELPQYWLDECGIFRGPTGSEAVRVPLPRKDGTPRCEIIALDGTVFPFTDADALRKVLVYTAKLPQRTYPLSDVDVLLSWVLNTSDAYRKELDKGPRPRARRESERWRENADWMGIPYG